MKVTLDRNTEIAWIEDVSAKWACRVGYFFGRSYPRLARWVIRAEAPPKSRGLVECYRVTNLDRGAGVIATFIDNLPEPPRHCGTCTCSPECCK